MTETVKEGSHAWLQASFFGKTGIAEVPTAIEYRIDDVASGAQIRDDTSVTPGSVVEITLTDVDNALVDPTRKVEAHRVTFMLTYAGGSEKLNADYVYDVQNLAKV